MIGWQALSLIGIGGPIRSGAGHGEGLWMVGQPAPPPNGVGCQLGASGLGEESWVVDWLTLPPIGVEGAIWGGDRQGEGLQEGQPAPPPIGYDQG